MVTRYTKQCQSSEGIAEIFAQVYNADMQVFELKQQVLSLPSEARALLAEEILESLDGQTSEATILDSWLDAAELRMAEILNGDAPTLSKEEVFKRVQLAIS